MNGDQALEEALLSRLQHLVDSGLRSRDLTLAWMSHRLLPLCARAHKMCFYSGLRDPTRTSMEVLHPAELRYWESVIVTDKVGSNRKFGWGSCTSD